VILLQKFFTAPEDSKEQQAGVGSPGKMAIKLCV